jgi:hypothetical protein
VEIFYGKFLFLWGEYFGNCCEIYLGERIFKYGEEITGKIIRNYPIYPIILS